MKAVTSNVYREIRVVQNTEREDRPQWAKIIIDGQIVHTGQTSYIKRVAKERYNLLAKIQEEIPFDEAATPYFIIHFGVAAFFVTTCVVTTQEQRGPPGSP